MSDDFDQARRLFVEGIAHFEAGRLAPAEACFVASLALLPGRVSTLVNLAAVRIKLGRPDAALPPLADAISAAPDDAGAWMHRGVALGQLGKHDDALACDDRALALAADLPAAWYHKGMTLGALGRHAQALEAFERLLALTPDNAEAQFRHGQTLQYLDRHALALPSYEAALAIDPRMAQAWTNRGNILKDLGRTAEAAECFRRAIANGGGEALNSYYLAALTGESVPATPPRAYVEQLFDEYAGAFDEHVVGALGYRGHSVLIEPLASIGSGHFRHALDLGCGTGLCGPLLKAIADRVDGVDLSASMLDKARALGAYDRLDHADLAEHLAQTVQRHDLVIAADVFIYVGTLEPVFDGVVRVLDAGGIFCFSLEQADDGVDFELRPSLRYAHSRRYVAALAARSGFEMVLCRSQSIREDQRRPIPGLYVYLRRL